VILRDTGGEEVVEEEEVKAAGNRRRRWWRRWRRSAAGRRNGGGGGGGAVAAAARGEEEWRGRASRTTSVPARHAARSTLARSRPPPPHPAHHLPRQAGPRGVEMKTARSEQRRSCLREARRKLQK